MLLTNLLAELRRRRVVRVAGVYAVVSFVVLQVADLVLPALRVPEWGLSLVLALLLLGFPVALVLAWAFEVTPDGIRRAEPAALSGGRSRAALFAGGLALLTAVAALPVYRMTRGPAPEEEATSAPRSIAVLPFDDMSPEHDQEYFSDGVAEEILNVLAQMPGLRVAARTSSFSFKNKELPVADIARELKVEAVLEGSVRKAGTRVRITAQLIDARSGYHLWSETYDRELADVFAIQDEIGRAIAGELRIRLAGDVPAGGRKTGSMEAHDLYLLGMHAWHERTPESLDQAAGYFRRAIEADPGYALAHAGLGAVLTVIPYYTGESPAAYMKDAEAAVRRGIELDPTLPETQAALGQYASMMAWDWELAESALRRAIELNPNYASAHQWYAEYLFAFDYPRALEEMRRAIELDPVSPIINANYGGALVLVGRAEEGLAQLRRTTEIAPEFAFGYARLSHILLMLDRFDQAVAPMERFVRLMGQDPSFVAPLLEAMENSAARGQGRAIMAALESSPLANPFLMAFIWVKLGDLERAIDWLERGYELRNADIPSSIRDPAPFGPLRGHPRYEALLLKIWPT